MTKPLSAGDRLSRAVTEAFELDEHEQALLVEAADTLNMCRSLQAAVDRDGVLMATRAGVRAHPAAVELRAQRLTLARLLAALRVPAGEVDDGRVQARRGGPRGVYGMVS